MKFIINKKDIIGYNQEFDSGVLINEHSLDFAIAYARRTENWLRALAFLTRAILIDHVFEDGNKRTAGILIKSYAEFEGFDVYDGKLALLIKKILKNNITDIPELEEEIKNVIKSNNEIC